MNTTWTDEDSGAMLRAIDAIERIASGMTQTSADHLFAKTKPRKMTITDAKELASVHLPVLRRLFHKMEGFHVAASPVEQLVAAPIDIAEEAAEREYFRRWENELPKMDGEARDRASSAQAAEPVAQWQYSVLTPGYKGDWHNCNAETAQRLQQPDLADFHKVRALYAASLPPALADVRDGMTDALRQAREELSLVEWENDPPARVTELLTTIDALLVASPDQRAGGNRANC